jgi:hypothetical protein
MKILQCFEKMSANTEFCKGWHVVECMNDYTLIAQCLNWYQA